MKQGRTGTAGTPLPTFRDGEKRDYWYFSVTLKHSFLDIGECGNT